MTTVTPPPLLTHASVVVVTPHPVVAAGLRAILEANGAVVEVAGALPHQPATVVLYDVSCSYHDDGLDLALWERLATRLILIDTDHGPEIARRRAALENGAIPLSTSAHDLVELVHTVARSHA